MQRLTHHDEWQVLPLNASAAGRVLFYDLDTTSNSLHLLVTDLISIWETALEHDQIIEEARDQHCSIDPSESSSQFDALLSKLADSLSKGDNHLIRLGCVVEGALRLQTSISLPTPLQPLRWLFELRDCGPAKYASHLTIPCLEKLFESAEKLESLVQVIKEKDHVITKLLDRIEASAIDLSLIFPGITGLKARKQHVSIVEASKHVPGLGAFDRDAWAAENGMRAKENDGPGLQTLSSALTKIDAAKNLELSSDDWLTNLPRAEGLKANSDTELATAAPVGRASRRSVPGTDDESTSSEDDFEVGRTINKTSPQKSDLTLPKRTPPNAAKEVPHLAKSKSTASSTASGSCTDSESDSGLPYKPLPKRTKLGTFGKLTPKKSPPKNHSKLTHKSDTEDDETASPSSSDAEADSNYDAKPKAKLKPKPISKLGMLGGRKKQSQSPARAPAPKQSSSSNSTPSSHRKLGLIGRRFRTSTPAKSRHATPSDKVHSSPMSTRREADLDLDLDPDPDTDTDDATVSSSPTHTKPLPSPPPPSEPEPESDPEPETAEQAASRRREELKRTLNASGGGAKKKRRF